MSTSLLDLDPLVIPLLRGRRILDLGCGYGHWGHLVTTHYCPDPANAASRAELTGVDLHESNAVFARRAGTYRDVVHADALDYLAAQADGAFDTVLAIDLIEHLTFDAGERLLREAERVAACRVILATPAFENLRGGHEGITGFNPHDAHVSCWNWRELRVRGYRVRGVRHNLRGRIFRVRGGYRLLQAWPAVDELLDLLASRQPRWAHTLLVWKDTGLARARACGIESASR